MPAEGVLTPGMRIISINGKDVTTAARKTCTKLVQQNTENTIRSVKMVTVFDPQGYAKYDDGDALRKCVVLRGIDAWPAIPVFEVVKAMQFTWRAPILSGIFLLFALIGQVSFKRRGTWRLHKRVRGVWVSPRHTLTCKVQITRNV